MTERKPHLVLLWLMLTSVLLRLTLIGATAAAADAVVRRPGQPMFLSPQTTPLAAAGGFVYAANTAADTLDVISSTSRQVVARIPVGLDPVGVAVRPDGQEVWVANHISDSISVIDLRAGSRTFRQITATIQDFEPQILATRFDEPVSIAFAGSEKAYVTLSSENVIAVIDGNTKQIVKRLPIPAQDPRAIAVRGDRLYVLPFESGNQTQLSGGVGPLDGNLKTFDAWDHSIANNNVLSLGHVVDIVRNPRVPDRDLFVFDCRTDRLLHTVSSLGTLLYGLSVDVDGTVWVAGTEARNDVNGRAGSRKHGLLELQNRPFLNRLTKLRFPDGVPGEVQHVELEPLPPDQPAAGMALATPAAVQVADNQQYVVAVASGSDMLFTVHRETGAILGRVRVGAVPQGLVLEPAGADGVQRAWVLNAADNTVSVVRIEGGAGMAVESLIVLEDPTDPVLKLGRIAFSTAAASSTETFSCASCHPDGHTDQLLWVLKTPIVTGGNQIMPRSTMPIRGLQDTAPFHWDGIPGDPYGGINSASIHTAVPPNSDRAVPTSAARNLIDGGLASTMLLADSAERNDEGLAGRLSAVQRDAMAKFLLSVPYPPAQRRSSSDVLSQQAKTGFQLFHMDGDNDPSKSGPNVCGDCHRLPFLVSTNTPGTGMETPTWRGAYDRWLILPQGRLNIIDFDFYRAIAEAGNSERSIWQLSWAGRRRFDPVWDMVLEGSTGFSGALGRQVTISGRTAEDGTERRLLRDLELAAAEGSVVLQCEGVLQGSDQEGVLALALQYLSVDGQGWKWVDQRDASRVFSTEELLTLSASERFTGTVTARAGEHCDSQDPQPALWTWGPLEQQRGHQLFPQLRPGRLSMVVGARHLQADSAVFVDGRRVAARFELQPETLKLTLSELPAAGLHFLQLRNPDGLFSNEFLFTVAESADDSAALQDDGSLGAALQRSGLKFLPGTWVDAETQGSQLTLRFEWKIEGRVLESSSRDANGQSVALMTRSPDGRSIEHHGGDREGRVFSGVWTSPENGQARLTLQVQEQGNPSASLVIRYDLLDENHLDVTLELPDPIRVSLVRKQ